MTWSIFFLGVGILFALGVVLIVRVRNLYQRTVRTRAKIIGSTIRQGTTGINYNKDPDSEYFRVEFVDQRGETLRVQLWESTRAPSDPIDGNDGRVAILYDPKNPEKVWLDSFAARYTVAIVCMMPALLVILFLAAVKTYLWFRL
jgi:hypothetical protein